MGRAEGVRLGPRTLRIPECCGRITRNLLLLRRAGEGDGGARPLWSPRKVIKHKGHKVPSYLLATPSRGLMQGTQEIFLLGLFEVISLLYFGRCCPGAFVLANSWLSGSPCLRECCLGASVWTVTSCCFRRFCPGAGVYPQVPADVKRKNLCSLLKANI